jgi:general secretion pathway protein L
MSGSSFGGVTAAFSLWIDAVARAAAAPLDNIRPVRRIEVAEDDTGGFSIRLASKAKHKDQPLSPCRVDVVEGALSPTLSPGWTAAIRGGRVELVLRPSRFLFRPLELPSRAAEFIDGIVKSQIDRLTPWHAGEAAYHWTAPQDGAGDRIHLTVVATARAAVAALAQAFLDIGAAAVAVSTAAPGADRVTVYNQRPAGQTDSGRLRFALVAALAATGVLATLSTGLSGFATDYYDTQQQQIQRRIAERRAILRGNQSGSGSSAAELLERRKQTTPSSVMVIEALSALLPDHTYATEVRIEGDRLQVVGITRDAPSLIQILESSPHFSRVAFFAPTTRAANDPGERFHIEARLKPYFEVGI